ncbi:MAG: ABC transporter, partial [Oxalobacteraceae bacterium]
MTSLQPAHASHEATSSSAEPPVLKSGEVVLASMEPDLDEAMQFSVSQILLTTERIISYPVGSGGSSWPLHERLSLHHADHAGVATLSLHDHERCLARWRFTLEQEVGAL